MQAFLICGTKVFGDSSECANTGLFAPFLFVCRKTEMQMRKTGSILLAMAALSLLGALFSAGRDADTAGGRFMGALILGGIGFLLLYLGNNFFY